MAMCPECNGEGIIITCCDDMCNGIGHCIHGDGEEICPECDGSGEIDDWEDDDQCGIAEGYESSAAPSNQRLHLTGRAARIDRSERFAGPPGR